MPTTPILSDSRAPALLQSAAQWRLIALLFEPPEGPWHEQVASLADEVDDPALKQAAAAALRPAEPGIPLEPVPGVAAADASCSLYHSTFGPGGPAAAREVSYRKRTLPGPMLSELAAFYEAFGYRPALAEPPDHVAVEAGFVAFLRFKEAYAVTREQWEQAAMAAEAAQRFQDDHLAMMAQPLATSLAASGIEYLQLISAALLDRVGPRPEPLADPPGDLPTLDDFECGAAE